LSDLGEYAKKSPGAGAVPADARGRAVSRQVVEPRTPRAIAQGG